MAGGPQFDKFNKFVQATWEPIVDRQTDMTQYTTFLQFLKLKSSGLGLILPYYT